ncbi:unnamed protein product [Adineta ricciae]|uniref:G-protein coupled receptors family 1 profile domain-containing protein n=1 Tax=Adineta ricciae TaxID=249248 RepID=A0A813ZBB0_ADIRI|nr:unnamed protein product [Adineta ricciae]CAF1452009.1 unnamed protein product [Adineta ricciae]
MLEDIVAFSIQYSLYAGYFSIVGGVIGNALNILTLTQLKLFRNNRSAFYLVVESTANFFSLFLSIAVNILISLRGDDATGTNLIWCRFRYTTSQTISLITSYTLCFAACDQFLSTNFQLNLRNICTIRLARYLTSIFACIWLTHSIVFVTFFEIQPQVGCVILNPISLRYSTYFFYPALVGLLPICIASLFNILAFRNVRRIVRRQLPIARRRLDQQMTAMVLTRVVMLVSLLLPYTLFRIYVINVPIVPNQSLSYAIRRLFQAIVTSCIGFNNSLSCFVFMIISPRYRRQVSFTLRKKCWRKMKSVCCIASNQVAAENLPSPHSSNIELE